eukprot:Pompholyxophrys_punicea_v1_NODE_429_length_1988_cov_7.455768.p2 type:complete len:150 gc:universal NODE_429_length_1988_cov_7.455768:944-495(-)
MARKTVPAWSFHLLVLRKFRSARFIFLLILLLIPTTYLYHIKRNDISEIRREAPKLQPTLSPVVEEQWEADSEISTKFLKDPRGKNIAKIFLDEDGCISIATLIHPSSELATISSLVFSVDSKPGNAICGVKIVHKKFLQKQDNLDSNG